jgi:hypothetical protein
VKGVSFANLAYENKKKRERREKFLPEIDQVILGEELAQIIKRYYPRSRQWAVADTAGSSVVCPNCQKP